MKISRSVSGLIAGLCLFSSVLHAAADTPDSLAPSPDTGLLSSMEAVAIVPVGGNVTSDETADLVNAIKAYRATTDAEDFSPLDKFLQDHPDSAYCAGVLTNLGYLAFQFGYYSKAIDYYERAWNIGKALDMPKTPEEQEIVSGAGIRLAGLYSRVGRRVDLEALIKALKPYPRWGGDENRYEHAMQAASMMELKPGISYNCGPLALLTIVKAHPEYHANAAVISQAKATPDQGFSVEQLENLAHDAGLNFVSARRAGDAELSLPAVVHWKVGHYAAVLEEENERYLVKDPTFVTDFWMSAKALNEESSGVFLFAADKTTGQLPNGWSLLGAEKSQIFGKGVATTQDENNQPPPVYACQLPMAAVSFNMFEAKAYVTDTPLSYSPPRGPAMAFQLNYYQGELPNQVPSNTSVIGSSTNATWSMSYFSAVKHTSSSNSTVTLLTGDGRKETYSYVTSYDSSGNYSGNINMYSGAVIEQLSGNDGYIQHFPDGSAVQYKQPYSSSTNSTQYFLPSAIVDPQGNYANLTYGTGNYSDRLASITDNSSNTYTLNYANTTNATTAYWLTGVSSNLGGNGNSNFTLNYDSDGRLCNITDPVGIVSHFTYNGNTTPSTIENVLTPYGNTSINITAGNVDAHYDPSAAVQTLLITDPEGNSKRVSYCEILSDAAGDPPDLDFCTLYFDQRAMSELTSANDTTYSWLFNTDGNSIPYYDYAQVYQWSQNGQYYNNATAVVGVPECIVAPFAADSDTYTSEISPYSFPANATSVEYNYNHDYYGNPIISQPTIIDYGSGEVSFTYNNLGRIASYTDASYYARETLYTYASNQIDLTSIQQATSADFGNYTIDQEFGYSSGNIYFQPYTINTVLQYPSANYTTNHLPLLMIDAAGSKTYFSYTNGTLNQVQRCDANSTALQTISYGHYANGYVENITVSGSGLGGSATVANLTYANGSVQTATDVQGITATYTYDPLQRVTGVSYSDNTTETLSYTNTTINGTVTPYSLSLRLYSRSFFDPVANTNVTENISTTYNADGQPLVVTPSFGSNTTYDWCGCGGLNSLSYGNDTTSFTYDLAGRMISKNITVGGEVSSYGYGYDNSNRLITVTLPTNATISYDYNEDNTIYGIYYTGVTGAIAPSNISFEYDAAFPRVTSMEDGLGTANYTYGNTGSLGAMQLTEVSGPWPFTNATLHYTYDALGRLTVRAVESDDGTVIYQSTNSTIDALDRVTTVVVAGQALNGTAINLGNFTNITYSGNSSDLTGIQYPNGMNTTLSYFNATMGCFLANITNNASNSSLISEHLYTHRGDGSVSTWEQQYPWNSLVNSQVVKVDNVTPPLDQLTAYSYDPLNELTEAKFGEPSGNVTSPVEAVWNDYTYTYDGAGNRLTNNVSGWATANNTANLTGNFSTTATLTGNFNTDNSLTQQTRSGRVEVTGTVDKPAQVTANELPTRQWALPGGIQWAWTAPLPLTIGNATTANVTVRATDAVPHTTTNIWTVGTGNIAANFTYDANGDMLTRVNDPGTSLAATANYTWDSIGELSSVQQGNNTVSFTYDGLGRRVELSANIGGNTTNEYYLWDGDQIVEKRVGGSDAANITAKYFDYGYQTVSGNTANNYFYTKDHLGGIQEVVANDGNTVEGRFIYGPWGETTYLDYSGGNVAEPQFGFAGYFQTPYVPGLYLPEHRPYDPILGRWLSRDPIGEFGGLNLYGYAGNNPVNNTDPSGLIYLAGNSHPNNGPWNAADTAAIGLIAAAPLVALASPDVLAALGLGATVATQEDPDLPDQISQIGFSPEGQAAMHETDEISDICIRGQARLGVIADELLREGYTPEEVVQMLKPLQGGGSMGVPYPPLPPPPR
jgi:RHS repeat-associated protein